MVALLPVVPGTVRVLSGGAKLGAGVDLDVELDSLGDAGNARVFVLDIDNVLLALVGVVGLAAEDGGENAVVLAVEDARLLLSVVAGLHVRHLVRGISGSVSSLGLAPGESSGLKEAREVLRDERLDGWEAGADDTDVELNGGPDSRKRTDPGVIARLLSLDDKNDTNDGDDSDESTEQEDDENRHLLLERNLELPDQGKGKNKDEDIANGVQVGDHPVHQHDIDTLESARREGAVVGSLDGGASEDENESLNDTTETDKYQYSISGILVDALGNQPQTEDDHRTLDKGECKRVNPGHDICSLSIVNQ